MGVCGPISKDCCRCSTIGSAIMEAVERGSGLPVLTSFRYSSQRLCRAGRRYACDLFAISKGGLIFSL